MSARQQTVRLTVAEEHGRLRVDAFLALQLPWRSRRSVAALLAEGAVAVNDRRVKKSHRLAPGDVVALRVPASPEAPLDLSAIELSILHEDDELVVVNKPGDLAMHPASTCQQRNLLRRLEHFYAHERPDPRVQPSVIHRLDRTTSGVVALVKRRELVAPYTRQFAERTPTKEYVAIVQGRLVGEGRLEQPIHTPADRPVVVSPGGKPSRTDYRTLAHAPRASRLALVLHSGRKHQIRAHLAAHGHPLVYDDVYGPARDQSWPDDARPLLHAARLELDHRDGRRLCFEAPVPDDMERAWACLREDSAD